MTQDEFKAKYNGGDKRTAKEKNLECDCYLPDSDKLATIADLGQGICEGFAKALILIFQIARITVYD